MPPSTEQGDSWTTTTGQPPMGSRFPGRSGSARSSGWSLFFAALIFLGVFCRVSLVQRQWIREEKLTFPLLTLPWRLLWKGRMGQGSARNRRILFLFGFGLAALFQRVRISCTRSFPAVPAHRLSPPRWSGLLPQSTLDPLAALSKPFYICWRSIGIGYFVPLGRSVVSIWFFYLINRVFAVAGIAAGYEGAGGSLHAGAECGRRWQRWDCCALGTAVGRCRAGLRRAFVERGQEPETRSERWAWIGLAAVQSVPAGLLPYGGLFPAAGRAPTWPCWGWFALVYARIRPSTGVPLVFVYPYGLPQRDAPSDHLSAARAGVGRRAVAGPFLQFCVALPASLSDGARRPYQMDGYKTGGRRRASRRRTLFIALCVAFAVGLLAAYWST